MGVKTARYISRDEALRLLLAVATHGSNELIAALLNRAAESRQVPGMSGIGGQMAPMHGYHTHIINGKLANYSRELCSICPPETITGTSDEFRDWKTYDSGIYIDHDENPQAEDPKKKERPNYYMLTLILLVTALTQASFFSAVMSKNRWITFGIAFIAGGCWRLLWKELKKQ